MEQAFRSDFGGVRVHTDQQADQLNRSVQAKAFTIGSDIYFRKGNYGPSSAGGQELLAHELTHVVQQGGSNHQVQGKLTLGPAGDRYEQEADQAAADVTQLALHYPARVQSAPTKIQRWPSWLGGKSKSKTTTAPVATAKTSAPVEVTSVPTTPTTVTAPTVDVPPAKLPFTKLSFFSHAKLKTQLTPLNRDDITLPPDLTWELLPINPVFYNAFIMLELLGKLGSIQPAAGSLNWIDDDQGSRQFMSLMNGPEDAFRAIALKHLATHVPRLVQIGFFKRREAQDIHLIKELSGQIPGASWMRLVDVMQTLLLESMARDPANEFLKLLDAFSAVPVVPYTALIRLQQNKAKLKSLIVDSSPEMFQKLMQVFSAQTATEMEHFKATVLAALNEGLGHDAPAFLGRFAKLAPMPDLQSAFAAGMAQAHDKTLLRAVLKESTGEQLFQLMPIFKKLPTGDWQAVRDAAKFVTENTRDLPRTKRQSLVGISEVGIHIDFDPSQADPNKPPEEQGWSDELYGELMKVLKQLPQSHLRGNENITSIRYTGPSEDFSGPLSQASSFAYDEKRLNIVKPAAEAIANNKVAKALLKALLGIELDEKGRPTDQAYLRARKGGIWQTIMDTVMAGSFFTKRATFGRGTLLSDKGTSMFGWTVRHEMGHAVDTKVDFTGTVAHDPKYGAWKKYEKERDAAKDMFAATGLTPPGNVLDFVGNSIKTGRITEIPEKVNDQDVDEQTRLKQIKNKVGSELKAENSVLGQWRAALKRADRNKVGKVIEAMKVGYGGQTWMRPDDGGKILGGRLFHEDQYNDWVSYKADHRKHRLSNYQFSSPAEWFAEGYAAYYDDNPSVQKNLLTKCPELYAWFDKHLGRSKDNLPLARGDELMARVRNTGQLGG
jgi:hypothetical protein